MENGQEAFAAAIVDLVQQLTIAPAHVCRAHDVDIRIILDTAPSIARGCVEVDDNGIARMLRVQLSIGCTHQADVGAYCPKSHPISKGLNTVDLQAAEHTVFLPQWTGYRSRWA